jgi:hypothetical protein
MSKYRTTYHVITLAGTHLKSQATLERLKADDPCWSSGTVWSEQELAIEEGERGSIKIIVVDSPCKPTNLTTKPHWSNS